MNSLTPPAMPRLHATLDEARRAPIAEGHLSGLVMAYGSMELRWFEARAVDEQTPHDRDELYVVVCGNAMFVRAEERTPFGEEHDLSLLGQDRVAVRPGDALFVPAGTVHRFEAMSADFGAWMVFYGPEGGEQP